MNSALDLEEWLDDLSARDYGIMEGRMAGYSLPRIATDLGVSTSTIFARAKKLGLELASRAGVHVDMNKTRSGRTRQERADGTADSWRRGLLWSILWSVFWSKGGLS